MAKAHITTKDGAKITIEGTPEEVAAITEKLGSGAAPSLQKGSKRRESKLKATPMGLLGSLIDGNFFRKPKDLGAVKTALEEMGHVYPVTTLSPILLRLVRKRQLRRIKDKNRWLYTG
ncbi:MAG: hypothetical protein ACXV7C_11580 [Candidatus Angelobacter sp.]